MSSFWADYLPAFYQPKFSRIARDLTVDDGHPDHEIICGSAHAPFSCANGLAHYGCGRQWHAAWPDRARRHCDGAQLGDDGALRLSDGQRPGDGARQRGAYPSKA
jgi:hypothetical protein